MKKRMSFLLILLLMGCLEEYTPPEVEGAENVLVVDGFLNGTSGMCTVRLTRSQNILSEEAPPQVLDAQVALVEDGGGSTPLTQVQDGVYQVAGLSVQPSKKYKLSIRTSDGKSFESDIVELRDSPPIDSVTWRISEFGLEILANTHDDTGKSKYYKWDYVETYAYASVFDSNVYFENGNVFFRDEDIHSCFKSNTSRLISIGNSSRLAQDLIVDQVVNTIPRQDVRTQIRYSILVQQSVLTKEAYDFFLGLQKNTQNLGTLFDPLPSQILGNLHGVDGNNDDVLGYFYGSYVQEKRIFILPQELPGDFYFRNTQGCVQDTVLLSDVPAFSGPYLFTVPITVGGVILIGYGYSSTYCVDCRYAGGTTVKPDFW